MMAQPAYTAPAPNRPLGVAIIAVLLGLYGFLTFIGGLLVIVLSNYGLVVGGTYLFGLSASLVGIVLVFLGLIELGVAVGLWHLRMWALVLAVLVLLFDLARPTVNIALGKGVGSSVLGFIIAVLLLIYLIAIRRHFR
jgi:hypothetical protein